MLIELRVANHRSIREEQILTMEVGRIASAEDARPRVVAGAEERLLPAVAIYGANASGKSNVISALAFMTHAVGLSHRQWPPEGGVPRDPFAWGMEASAPSLFECTFVLDGVRHQYGFSANDEIFLEEWLYAWPHGRKQVWFERDLQEFKFGEHLRGENRLVEQVTRPNSLFLSAAAQNRHEQLAGIYSWFRSVWVTGGPEHRLRQVDVGDTLLRSTVRHHQDLGQQPELFPGTHGAGSFDGRSALLDLLRAADVGIVDIKAERDPSGDRRDQIFLRHRSRTGEAWLPLREESAGTRTLLRLASGFLATLRSGSLLVVDELESSLHPLLGLHLVQQFNDPVRNPRNAQLVFTTHDTNLLGTTLGPPALRRDQVWLTEKDDDGATKLYPLTDYTPRKAENLETGYLQGRYGAIPFLGDFARVTE